MKGSFGMTACHGRGVVRMSNSVAAASASPQASETVPSWCATLP